MILSYSKDKFIPRIINGIKTGTIRKDAAKRWKAGMSIQHWRGNPRNVNQNPYEFATGVVKEVNGIILTPDYYKVKYTNPNPYFEIIDASPKGKEAFAIADGFDSWEDLCSWFFKTEKFFEGRHIIFNQPVISTLPPNP
jgi:hypothetical protein